MSTIETMGGQWFAAVLPIACYRECTMHRVHRYWLRAATLAALAFACQEPAPDDIGPSGPSGTGGAQVDGDVAIDATGDVPADDAIAAATPCERACSLSHHCEYVKDYAACVIACDEQLLECTEAEAQEVAKCVPTQYAQCGSTESCLSDITCIEVWQDTW